MVETATISQASAILLGLAGAMFTLGMTLVMPAAIRLSNGGTPPNFTAWVIIGASLVVLLYAAAGVVAVLAGNPKTVPDAITYGMACQATAGGIFNIGKAAVG